MNYVISPQQKIQIIDYWPDTSICYEIDEFNEDDNIRKAVAAYNGLLRPIDNEAELALVTNALQIMKTLTPNKLWLVMVRIRLRNSQLSP